MISLQDNNGQTECFYHTAWPDTNRAIEAPNS